MFIHLLFVNLVVYIMELYMNCAQIVGKLAKVMSKFQMTTQTIVQTILQTITQ
jgi:hypothetical protein